jgi:tetratricopeptide (TPR) repeat protein
MKTKLVLLTLSLLVHGAVRGGDAAGDALQQGLFEEEANQNLEAAIPHYQRAVARIEDQRRLAATAVFRLGECFRKLGRTNEAAAQYERLLRDFPDQTNLVALGRQHLQGWGMAPVALPALLPGQTQGGLSPAGRAKLRELVASEIEIAKQLLAEQRKLVEIGVHPIGIADRFERDVLGLKRQLLSVDGLATPSKKQEWRNLLLQEISLAEKAVRAENDLRKAGLSSASEEARLQRDLLALRRELVAFDESN